MTCWDIRARLCPHVGRKQIPSKGPRCIKSMVNGIIYETGLGVSLLA